MTTDDLETVRKIAKAHADDVGCGMMIFVLAFMFIGAAVLVGNAVSFNKLDERIKALEAAAAKEAK